MVARDSYRLHVDGDHAEQTRHRSKSSGHHSSRDSGRGQSTRRTRSRSRSRRQRTSSSKSKADKSPTKKYKPPVPTKERRSRPPADRLYITPANSDLSSRLTIDSEAFHGNSPQYQLNDQKQTDAGIQLPSPKHRENLNRWYQKRLPKFSRYKQPSHVVDTDGFTLNSSGGMSSEEGGLLSNGVFGVKREGDFAETKQSVAIMAIVVTVAQLLILMLQLAMCGMAGLDINPFLGPYPDAFSEWGGKNAYLMLKENQWFRLITPSFLHVGFVHFILNATCQLDAIALFEREWGTRRWVLIYVISSIGCNTFSSYFDQDTIAVGSSGALMGLYAAKLAQVCSSVFFENKSEVNDEIRLDQLSSVLCGLTLISLLSSFTYIDWSGHMGGLLCGYLSGMFLFSRPIKSCCTWFFWTAFGILGLVASLTSVLYYFVETADPMEDIGDACEWFRSLFPEDYDCGCLSR